jgi:quercetin dioxygenase-like cupin family protein
MKAVLFPLLLVTLPLGLAMAADVPIVANPDDTKWQRESTDPPGAQSIVLREDAQSGAFEMLVRYPAGHVFSPHWHTANERIVLLEGKLSIEVGSLRTSLEPGGFAYLPAKQIQRMSCVSTTRCAFYVGWDGKLDFHKAAGN